MYKNQCIYFHCALAGHKLEIWRIDPKVAFCVVGKTRILPAEFATEYESAVAFGVASEVQGAERFAALVWLLEKYSPGFIAEGNAYIAHEESATKVMKIEIAHLAGKARITTGALAMKTAFIVFDQMTFLNQIGVYTPLTRLRAMNFLPSSLGNPRCHCRSRRRFHGSGKSSGGNKLTVWPNYGKYFDLVPFATLAQLVEQLIRNQ